MTILSARSMRALIHLAFVAIIAIIAIGPNPQFSKFSLLLLFLQQFLIPFAASKKSSICFDLSIRRILLHRSGIKRLPCVFVQGAEAPKNEGHFSKTTFILFCLLCRGLYDHLSSFPTGAAAFFILH